LPFNYYLSLFSSSLRTPLDLALAGQPLALYCTFSLDMSKPVTDSNQTSGINDISKKASLHPERPMHLTHLTHKASIANQDAMSIRRCVPIPGFLAPCVQRPPAHRPLRPVCPDCLWCSAPGSCQRLVLCAFVLSFLSPSSFRPDRF